MAKLADTYLDERDAARTRLAAVEAAARGLVGKQWPRCQSPRCSARAEGIVVTLDAQTLRCDECWAELGGRWMRFAETEPLAALVAVLGEGESVKGEGND